MSTQPAVNIVNLQMEISITLQVYILIFKDCFKNKNKVLTKSAVLIIPDVIKYQRVIDQSEF